MNYKYLYQPKRPSGTSFRRCRQRPRRLRHMDNASTSAFGAQFVGGMRR